MELSIVSPDFETALMLAAMDRRTATVKFLLAHGANVQVRNNKGETALKYALMFGAGSELVKLLKVAGAIE